MPRPRQSRASRHAAQLASEVEIPDKLYFRIGEVSRLTQIKPYVLRYWQTEFDMLRPVKSRSGHRLYRRQDVETVLEIKRLLYGKGFTIEGARKELRSGGRQLPAAAASVDGAQLKSIRRELAGILTMLSRR